MEYAYSGVGFLIHLGLFFLAGYLGRYRIWWGILAPTIIVPCANFFVSPHLSDAGLGLVSGLLTGATGAILIPLIWAGRHGSTAGNGIRFLNISAMSRSTLHFNWIKDDNHPDNQTNRKRWTEKE